MADGDESNAFPGDAKQCPPPEGHPLPDRNGQSRSTHERIKAAAIVSACKEPCDIDLLASLSASEGGFLDDELRRTVWPLLLGCDTSTDAEPKPAEAWRRLPRHKDEDQVTLDVNRSFIYYPNDESENQLDRRKQELSEVITRVLRQYPMLCYFQGFHDIVQVLLLVLGIDLATNAAVHLSLLRIRDFMLPSLSPSLAHLQLLPSILYSADPKLCQHLSQTQPFFALATTLTMYAHDVQEYSDIARLFDFLLAHEAVVAVYSFASIILLRRDELFEIPEDEPEMLHYVLSKLPKPLDLEVLISRTIHLFEENPPEMLPFRAWGKVSPYSVLKATRGSLSRATLTQGQDLFAKQEMEISRQETRDRITRVIWKYRRPAGGISLAILIGVFSFWLRRSGEDHTVISVIRKLWAFARATAW